MSTPLVSIVVASYNASRSIVETLDSIKAQTYSPLELIIADDCSQDDTAAKCKEWLTENQFRFANSKLIVNSENKGTSANFNIGIKASSGEWIKIFGDDVLLPDAIEKNVAFAKENDSDIVSSKMRYYFDETSEMSTIVPPDDYIFPISNHDQFIAQIQNKLGAPAPTWFIKRELYDRLGGFNEHYRLFEDIPFAHKLVESGFCFSYMPQLTVLYRITNVSISNNHHLTGKQKQASFNDRFAIFNELQEPALKEHGLWGVLIKYKLTYFFYKKKIYSRDDSIARYFYGGLCYVFFKLLYMKNPLPKPGRLKSR